jgi:4-hydroxy-tetrahydrodipicolinate reductase
MSAIKVGIIGAAGKMGRRLTALGLEDPALYMAKGICSEECNESDLEIPRSTNLADLSSVDIAIDFSTPSLLPAILDFAKEQKKPLVIGTTGHAENALEMLIEAAQHIPLFKATNFSMGVFLLVKSAQKLAAAHPGYFSISIEETHQPHKKDSPSGTALTIRSFLPKNEKIPITSKREESVICEHSVLFDTTEEQLILKHSAKSRDLFAKGALYAAKFLIDRPPGLYGMADLYPDSD